MSFSWGGAHMAACLFWVHAWGHEDVVGGCASVQLVSFFLGAHVFSQSALYNVKERKNTGGGGSVTIMR